jgi:hypothetical protein
MSSSRVTYRASSIDSSGSTRTKRGSICGTFTRRTPAARAAVAHAHREVEREARDVGNGCAGSTASGISTGEDLPEK